MCRDFQHLAITFCRCLNIPARYATGYMGDIGVPFVPPMDFSAWFEVYLEDRWWTFDARNNKPRIGRVLMATGRDAADVAITTSFGTAWLTNFTVVSDEVVGKTGDSGVVFTKIETIADRGMQLGQAGSGSIRVTTFRPGQKAEGRLVILGETWTVATKPPFRVVGPCFGCARSTMAINVALTHRDTLPLRSSGFLRAAGRASAAGAALPHADPVVFLEGSSQEPLH